MKALLVVPVAVMALALSMSACGGESQDAKDATAPPVTKGSTPAAQPTQGGGTITGDGGGRVGGGNLTSAQKRSLAKMVACMRKKGYDMPDVGDSPVIKPNNVQGMDPNKVNKDSQDCAAQVSGG